VSSGIRLSSTRAVKEELKWFEVFACCRDRRGGLYNSEATRGTGKILAAAFAHETSRAKDPALHMHVLIANVTIDPEREEALPLRRAPGLRASTGTQWNQQLLAFLLVDSKTKAEKETFRFRFVPFQGFA
jgi:conjugative relaxase-like TrwC/TraI family protein